MIVDAASSSASRCSESWALGEELSPNGGGLKEVERRVFWRTFSTHASPSGLMEIWRERGLGPARPSGAEFSSGREGRGGEKTSVAKE